MNDFATLLSELEEFRKASPACDDDDKAKGGKPAAKREPDGDEADDKKIEAAAADGEEKSDKEKETFGKAFEVTLADGTKTEAFDGTEMLKALHAEHEGLRDAVDSQHGDVLKAFDMAVSTIREMRTQIAEQQTLLKSLGDKVATMGNAGVGRRTMLTIAEKLSPSAGVTGSTEAEKPTPGQVMMKAQFMARNGSLDWGHLPRIEAHQGRGSLAPDDLLKRYPELLTPIP